VPSARPSSLAGTVEEAIQRAIKEHDVPERERWRISVQREA
jgi:hypothetical protein